MVFSQPGPQSTFHGLTSLLHNRRDAVRQLHAVDRIFSGVENAGRETLRFELEVLEGPFKGRKLWKKFNLDMEKADKKGKTPSMKLADQLHVIGLWFSTHEELAAVNEKFVGMTVNVKAWGIKFKDRDDKVQVFNLMATGAAKSSATPASKPSF